MRAARNVTSTSAILALILAIGIAAQAQQAAAPKAPPRPGLTVTSPAFEDGGIIPNRYTQADPKPVSPRLEWTNVPDGTVSFALIMHDPDVARQRTTEDVLHWLIFNIPGTARFLPEGVPPTPQLPDGTVQAKNVADMGYRGPGAPAQGPHHHYTFELFALDIKLDLGSDATREDVLKAMNGHILGKGVVVGRFVRPKS
ncbi:MAG: YbhB/YbcL family Raf kinase inhibitor-like protein [Candidatus Korobacteraceae bacterium]